MNDKVASQHRLSSIAIAPASDYPTGKSSARSAKSKSSRLARIAKNIPLLALLKSNVKIRHPASTRGALRGRHGRWMRDAMDVKRRVQSFARTNGVFTDGEVVWS
jgi:hypothetical protein